MSTAAVQEPALAPAPGLPDWVTNHNAVLGDQIDSWRYGKAPDYAQTRKVFEETKTTNHLAGSLEAIAQNLVKNWEIEASFKTDVKDWRTINPEKYTFAINGGPPQDVQHMLKVGTYNALIAPNDFYSPDTSDFASSHKTFKRMMPRFAWEVIEVYSGPPKVSFTWRHWGVMKGDYVGFNDKGEKITAKAHGGTIEIFGVTVATVDEGLRVEALETWFDPLEMFRQIAPDGIVKRDSRKYVPGEDLAAALGSDTAAPTSATTSTSIPTANTKPHTTIHNLLEETRTSDSRQEQLADKPPTQQDTATTSAQKHSSHPNLDHQIVKTNVPKYTETNNLQALVNDLSETLEALKTALKQQSTTSEATSSRPSSSDAASASASAWVKVSAITSEDVPPREDTAMPTKDVQVELTPEDMSRMTSAECPFMSGAGVEERRPEERLRPGQGAAVAADSIQTRLAREEMSIVSPVEHAFMNRE